MQIFFFFSFLFIREIAQQYLPGFPVACYPSQIVYHKKNEARRVKRGGDTRERRGVDRIRR
jgi:hypothetical protein